jgi:predicted O-methyltransferase YrrM
MDNRGNPSTWIYGVALFLSAFLLFQIQPILAKLTLPWFGGTAGVWIVSLAFYQLTYLLGNVYAHLLIQRGGLCLSTRLHPLALLASLAFLPVVPNVFWQPKGTEEPVWRILGLLTATAGVPFLLLSATTTLLQAWYTVGRKDPRPYRFYALSNAGSLLALLSYPILLEPLVATHRQAVIWSAAYGGFVVLCGFLAWRQPHSAEGASAATKTNGPRWNLQLLWLFLAASASALLLSITQYVSQNIAAVPLLWIVPLSLYLLSLILCFDKRRWYRRSFFLSLLPVVLAGMIYSLSPRFENAPPARQVPLIFAGLFFCCMACHGELADLKPPPEFLSLFYLLVSAGGALGGISVAVLAPRVFRGFYELPLSLALCAFFILMALFYRPPSPRGWTARTRWFGASIVALLTVLALNVVRLKNRQLLMVRNFYGVLSVNILPPGPVRPGVTQLRHGTVVHGEEILAADRSDVPTTYYGEHSGAGITLLLERQRGNIRVGVIGLGIGTLARYGQKGDRYSFYEINPLVVDLAENLFDFISRSEAQVNIVPGDARLSLERQAPQEFDVLVVDAFSGDAIPVHLLTREAFELYFRHLRQGGVLAIHVSNQSLDLPRVVEAASRSVGARAVKVTNASDEASAVYESTWMLLDRSAAPSRTVSALIDDTVSLPAGTSSELQDKVVGVWTDDYSNLIEILK